MKSPWDSSPAKDISNLARDWGLRYYGLKGDDVVIVSLEEFSSMGGGAAQFHLRDVVRPGVEVSTVFLGINHRFHNEGPPLVFESMIFGGPLGDEQERYSTKAEAIAGHARMVKRAAFPWFIIAERHLDAMAWRLGNRWRHAFKGIRS